MTTFDWYLYNFLMGLPIMWIIAIIILSIHEVIIQRKKVNIEYKIKHKKDMELLYENCIKRLERMKELDMKEYIDVS